VVTSRQCKRSRINNHHRECADNQVSSAHKQWHTLGTTVQHFSGSTVGAMAPASAAVPPAVACTCKSLLYTTTLTMIVAAVSRLFRSTLDLELCELDCHNGTVLNVAHGTIPVCMEFMHVLLQCPVHSRHYACSCGRLGVDCVGAISCCIMRGSACMLELARWATSLV
jgi:hypothetical protein